MELAVASSGVVATMDITTTASGICADFAVTDANHALAKPIATLATAEKKAIMMVPALALPAPPRSGTAPARVQAAEIAQPVSTGASGLNNAQAVAGTVLTVKTTTRAMLAVTDSP